MKKQLVIIGIAFLLLTVGLSGCNEEEIADKYVGKYEFKISIEITNYASNNITAIIEIYGENYQ